MRVVRYGVFETNSSSTHAIAMPMFECAPPRSLHFEVDEFGWAWGEADTCSYFYTAIYETSYTETECNDKLNKLKNILENHNIEYTMTPPKTHTNNRDGCGVMYLDDGYIDHGCLLKEWVDDLLADETKLLRFLTDGMVFTGNDNCDSDEEMSVYRYQEMTYNYATSQEEKNPYYKPEYDSYEWFVKTN